MGDFIEVLKGLGTWRLVAVGSVALLLFIFSIFAISHLSGEPMALLYGGLSKADVRQVTAELGKMGERYSIEGQDEDIHVPQSRVTQLRMTLSQKGLPSDANRGFTIFDEEKSLGVTSFEQNVNFQRAVQEELEKTIHSLDQVDFVRVHIVYPHREVFSKEKVEPTAAVMVRMKTEGTLSQKEVQGIRYLVAGAVPDLIPDKVSIIDSHGSLLAEGFNNENGTRLTEEILQLQEHIEKQYATKIQALVSKIVGFDKVHVQVKVDVSAARQHVTSEDFDPNGQVIRSTVLQQNDENTEEKEQKDNVSVANNLPTAGLEQPTPETSSKSAVRESSETTNYEISRHITESSQEPGVVQRVSVAVLVDGLYTQNEDGTTAYLPQTEETMQKIREAVQSTIGFLESRGDQITVENTAFSHADEDNGADEDTIMGLKRSEFLRLAEILMMVIIAFFVVLMVVRPLIIRAFEEEPMIPDVMSRAEGQMIGATSGGTYTGLGNIQEDSTAGGLEEMVDIDQIEGRIKSSSLAKVSELLRRYPEESLNVIRTWMYGGES